MPAVFLDRLPLPSLQVYTVGSIVLLACSFHYAIQVTSEFGTKFNATGDVKNTVYRNSTFGVQRDITFKDVMQEHVLLPRAVEVVYFMLQEPMCIWTLINMTYCCFILIGKMIQKLVFGDLRVSEQQHIKDKFWNFVFYKFIFIFGVMNVQYMDEVVLWCSWFSILGFLHLLAQLCKDRCEYLSFSPMTPKWTHCRVLTLLAGILTTSFGLFVLCAIVGFHAGINTFAFMAAECSLVTVRTLYVIVRYAIHLCDVKHQGVWEKRATYVYYTELVFELSALSIDFVHHLHMLVWGNIFLSMASLVIAMQLRCLFYEIRHRLRKYKNYLRIVKYMEFHYPMATLEDLEKNNDDCAICWDYLDSARKLPCGHLFHNSCLRSWLEQDTSCPTCRKALNDNAEVEKASRSEALRHPNSSILSNSDSMANREHFFHFDGSRYVSWLPSFFVEVTHPNSIRDRQYSVVSMPQLESMAYQVQQLFPQMPLSVLFADLQVTQSVQTTIDNILEGRLLAPETKVQSNTNNQSTERSPNIPFVENEMERMQCSDQLSYLEDALFSAEVYTDVIDDTNKFPNASSLHSSTILGSRFSKSPEERERILAKRKENLIKLAKRKYMEKYQLNDH